MPVSSAYFQNIIQSAELIASMPSCVILDCRAKLGDANWGREAFHGGHIPGAQYADLDQHLAAQPSTQGRHPLPDPSTWLTQVQTWGVQAEQQVVLYDDAGGAYAARAWWMFRWLGHDRVAVLDGGLTSWTGDLEEGPGTQTIASSFAMHTPLTRLISSEDLYQEIQVGTDLNLIDARAQVRFNGEQEPIDPVAGHIPGAQCLPFQGKHTDAVYFKPAADLAARFAHNGEPPICYCGSGVTATHNILAMHIAGMPEPVLYADSWSGWITNPDRPIATV